MPKRILIALSAAYYDVTANFNLLATCEKIYTTQVRNFADLERLFGDRVRFVPDQFVDTVKFIRQREIEMHPGESVEFLDYDTLSTNARRFDETLATREAEITALEHSVQDLLQDTRRLNYLAKLGQYHPKNEENPAPFTEFVVLALQNQSLRDALDRLMIGVVFDTENRPVPTPLATVVAQSLADGTIRPVNPGVTHGPEGFRVDPMEIHAASS